MFNPRVAIAVALLLMLLGCRSQRLMHDLQNFHVHLLDQQEKHIMQNLVRASKGKPFLHFNLTEIFLDQLDTTNISGSLGETTIEKSTATFFTGAARALERTITTPWELMGKAERTGRMNIKLKPVKDSYVYAAYLLYAQNEDFLKEATEKDDKREIWKIAHAWCWYKPGLWRERELWYVPKGKFNEFRQLFLAVAIHRPPQLGIAVEIIEVSDIDRQERPNEMYYRATLRLDKPVPNEHGTLRLLVNKKKLKLILSPHDDANPNDATTDMFSVTGLAEHPSEELPLESLRGLFISVKTIEKSTAIDVQEQIEGLQNTLDRIKSIQSMP